MELAPRGTEKVTEEEVASLQCSPSSHQGQETVERKDGLPPSSFWEDQLRMQSDLEADARERKELAKRRQAEWKGRWRKSHGLPPNDDDHLISLPH